MSGILEILNQVSAAAIAAVLNSLWQAVAVAAVARFAMRFSPRMNAATRHALWWGVLAVVLLLPLAPSIRTFGQRAPGPITMAVPEISADEPIAAPPAVQVAPIASATTPLEVSAGNWPAWILAFWLAVVAVQLGRIVWSYGYLRSVKRLAHAPDPQLRRNFDAWLLSCRVGRPTRLLVSRDIASPMAVGFRSPAVVLPEPLLAQFQEPELDHVLLHELAHIARRDDWTNLSARLAGAILGLHPVAAWILRHIEREREIACDDWVVSMTGSARPYAASLARLFEVCFARRRMLLASPMAGSSSHLGERIEMLLHRSREFTPKASLVRVLVATVCLAALGIAGALTPNWLAFAEPQEPVAAAEAAELAQPAAPAARPVRPTHATTPMPAPAAPEAIAPQEPGSPTPFAPATPMPAPVAVPGFPSPEPAATPAPAAPVAVMAFASRQAASTAAPVVAPTPPPAAQSHNGSFLAALTAAGYGNLPVDEIIEMKNAGVTAEFLTGMNQAGWGKLSSKELVELTQRGVRPEYIRRMKDAGIKNLSLKDVIELATFGVRPSLIQEIHSLGFGPYTAQQAAQLAQNGLRPELFRALKDAGLGHAALPEIVEAQQAGLNERDLREARQYGSSLTLKQIVRLKTAGVI